VVLRQIPLDDVGERGHSTGCGQHVAGHLSGANEDNKGGESQTWGVEHSTLSVERWVLQRPSAESRPVIACYCATFLKPEMLHIYRQITGLKRCAPVVIGQKRENAERYPFEGVHLVPKPRTHVLRRFWFRQLRVKPWQISDAELNGLLGVLSETRARLLHIYFGHIAVHLLPLIRAWKHPSIVSFHGADVMVDMNKPAYREATSQMLDAVTLVLVRSESLRRAVVDLGCDPEKIEIQRTGIPLEEFPFRDRAVPKNGGWRFVQAGRLIEKKGLPVTLRAFSTFLKQHPNAALTIAGEGPLLPELQKFARALGVTDRVSFTGFVSQEQLREIYHRSHIFLHPSQTGRDGNQEGIPNSMLEAMATGLPVFATEHGGIPEAIENGVSGVLVPERDDEALARALLNATQDPDLLSRIARAGTEAVKHNFDWAAQAQRLEDIYLRIIGRTA
jgi:glycosyltransferase involved in cell wall biosynthesis